MNTFQAQAHMRTLLNADRTITESHIKLIEGTISAQNARIFHDVAVKEMATVKEALRHSNVSALSELLRMFLGQLQQQVQKFERDINAEIEQRSIAANS